MLMDSYLQTYSAEAAEALVQKQLTLLLDPAQALPHDDLKVSLLLQNPKREDILLPGLHRLGVLGGGQLGRYFLMAAKQRGYSTVLWTPEQTPPAKGLADHVIHAPFDDLHALADFAQRVDAVTVEFEAVPIPTLLALEALGCRVRPGSKAIAVCQNRALERAFLVANHIPVAPHVLISHKNELETAFLSLNEAPCVVKTTRFGYDGKGQCRIDSLEGLKKAWKSLGGSAESPLLLEHEIPFQREISILIARGIDGSRRNYPLIENRHVNGVLNVSLMPAPDTEGHTLLQAEDIAKRLVKALNYVGILCVEFFELEDGRLLVNELAPRPHNSGHLTIEACHVSQYQQQVSALTGLPLGNAEMHVQAVGLMNLLSNRWSKQGDVPHWQELLLRYPRLSLHLYGKKELRPQRKMGHVTLTKKNTAMIESAFDEINSILTIYDDSSPCF